MNQCAKCGKALRRVHRGFLQQFRYAAVFEYSGCGLKEYAPRPYRFHFGPHVRCPRCGTRRVTKRRQRDRIDPMYWSLLTAAELVLGAGKLFHCHLCRIQFYDRRNLAPDAATATHSA